MSLLRARDPVAAARHAVLILLVCAAVLAGYTILQPVPYGRSAVVISWVGVAVLLVSTALCRLIPAERLDRLGLCFGVAVGGILLLCTLNVLTHDTSAASQAFLAFPVLWVGSHLRRGAVIAVTALAVVANGVALVQLLPLAAALTDAIFFGAVLIVIAAMLVRAERVQERLVAALQEQARVDSLTGLVNRWVFDEALETALARPVPAGTALVLVDVDAFKTINDSHGHPVGDDVLVHLATILREQVRADDAVLSRLGGDELAVLLPDCSARVARRRAQDLLDAVRAAPLALPDGTLLALSISLGVAHVPQASGDLRKLYAAADGALYAAKRAGRGRVAVAPR